MKKNIITYSNPPEKIEKEETDRRKKEATLLKKQNKAVAVLKKYPMRKNCILCGKKLLGSKIWEHHGFEVIFCKVCGHLQTKSLTPTNYPFIKNTGYRYTSIYPRQNREKYNDRKKRIYQPKLRWIVNTLKCLGYSKKDLLKMTWLEIGCGGGYFISALNDFGVKNFKGIDKDVGLLKMASEYMGSRVEKSPINLADIVKKYPADIYVAFFVFEHMENSIDFFSSLSELPSGTLVIFSVPFFGLTHVFEKIIPSDYARSFDGSVHTQIFTRQSVNYAMGTAGFEIVAEWIFGQDSADIVRHILNNISEIPEQLISKNRVIGLERDLQSIINKADLADQRHFIAIKK